MCWGSSQTFSDEVEIVCGQIGKHLRQRVNRSYEGPEAGSEDLSGVHVVGGPGNQIKQTLGPVRMLFSWWGCIVQAAM